MTERPVGEADLHAYVDGQLDPVRRAEVARYLGDNPGEAARVTEWAATAALMREAFATPARAPVPARLDVHRMAAERVSRWDFSRVAAVAILGLAAGGTGGWFARGFNQPTGVAAIAREGVMAHQIFAGVSGAQKAGWADPRYTERLTAPNLSAAGYNLRQRHVVATDEGAGSIFLYQDAAGNWISVFVRPMHQAEMTAPMEPVREAPGWAWAMNGLGVSLVSSAPLLSLHGIADEVRRQFRS